MSGKILVPLDGSKLAEIALPYAEQLAARLEYEIILISVRSPAEDPYHPVLESYLEKTAEILKRKKKANVEPIIVGSEVLVGHPAERIIDYAEQEGVDLIIMATHGRTGVRRWALGSVADKVMRASIQPVLLIRANIDSHKKVSLGNILIPLDGSKQSEKVIPHVKKLASKLKSKVVLLHVIAQPYHAYAGMWGVVEVPYTSEELKLKEADARKYLEKVKRALSSKGIPIKTAVRIGDAAHEIIGLAEELNADIVAMSTHGRSGMDRWEYGSVTDKVLHAGNTPLLLIREPIGKRKKPAAKTAVKSESIESLVSDLASDNGIVRVKARRLLVAKDGQAVNPLVEALKSKNVWVRWEASKALGQIADPSATEALVAALRDKEFDVRWLAAEGLTRIGPKVVEPLLRALVKHPDSLWMREGAHHVLHDLPVGNLKQTLRPVLSALEDVEPSLEAAVAAETALDAMSKTH
jgi:nucleotide-binding universal stress UspA family protein